MGSLVLGGSSLGALDGRLKNALGNGAAAGNVLENRLGVATPVHVGVLQFPVAGDEFRGNLAQRLP